MALIDYYQIQEDLKTLLEAGPAAGWTTQPTFVFIEAMEREAVFSSMPFINIRMLEAEMEQRSLPNGYYSTITMEIDIITFDLSEFRKAATLRDDIMGEAQLAVQENPRFNSEILTASIAPSVRFGAGTPEGAGGHIAVGTFTVTVETYIEPT